MVVGDSEVARLRAELAVANARFVEAERVNRVLRKQLRDSKAREKRVIEQLAAIRRSASWRSTYPLRLLRRLLAGARS